MIGKPIIKQWKIRWRGLDGYALKDGRISYYPDPEDPERNIHILAHEAAHLIAGEGHSLAFWAIYEIICERLGITRPDWVAPWRNEDGYRDARSRAERNDLIEIWVQAIREELK